MPLERIRTAYAPFFSFGWTIPSHSVKSASGRYPKFQSTCIASRQLLKPRVVQPFPAASKTIFSSGFSLRKKLVALGSVGLTIIRPFVPLIYKHFQII